MRIAFRSLTLTYLVLILLSDICYSQSTYLEGFVFTNSGDSIKGWIDYRQWDKNPKVIKFKRNLESNDQTTYRIEDLRFFGITGRDKYVKAIVTKDIHPVDIVSLRAGAKDTTVSDTVFLRVLVEGKISLYQLTESKKVHFYVKEEGKDYQELTFKVYLTDDIYISEIPVYREQLNKLIPESKRPDPESSFLGKIKYNERDLISAVEKINLLFGSNSSYEVIKQKEPVSFFVGAGAVYSKLIYSKPMPFISELDYSNKFQPIITAGLDLAISRNLQRLFTRAELSYFKVEYEGASPSSFRDTFDYKVKLSNLAASLSVFYNLINHPSNRLYAGASFALNNTLSSENSLTKRYRSSSTPISEEPHLKLTKTWLSVHARAGYIVSKRIEIAGSFKLSGSFYYSITPSLLALTLNYHFKKQ